MSIIGFFGADSKCGTSQISLCCSINIAKDHPDKKVLFICAQQGPGDDYLINIKTFIEDLRPYIISGLYNACDIASASQYTENLYVIGGIDGLGKSFDRETMIKFINDMSLYFDHVICDCGYLLNCELSQAALVSSDKVFIVITQGEKCLRHLEMIKDQFSKLAVRPFVYVINKYDKNNPYDLSYLSKRLRSDRQSFFRIGRSSYGLQAEMQHKPLLFFRSKRFAKDIKAFCEGIVRDNEQ